MEVCTCACVCVCIYMMILSNDLEYINGNPYFDNFK